MDMAKIRENQRATAAENVKTDLVLDAIAKAENIQVSMEDVDAELSAIAAQHGATLDEVKNIIKSNGNMGLLLANILRRKAAHVVIDNAKEWNFAAGALSSGGRCDFIKKYNLKEKGCKT